MNTVTRLKLRYVLLVLLGVAALVIKSRYSGPFMDIARDYGGNFSASFAVYFIMRIAVLDRKRGRLLSAGAAFLIVGLFEATDGFGVMTNVYDPMDFLADALGVGVAFAVDRQVRHRIAPCALPPR